MAEAGAIVPPRVASKRGWPSGAAGTVHRFRRLAVAASLIAGDAVGAIAAMSLGGALTEMVSLEQSKHLSIVLLIPALFVAGLYSGAGPSPYERFRLRTLAISAFVAIDLLVGLPFEGLYHLLVVAATTGVSLLLFGHYVEAAIRAVLIHLDLWGAPTALVGCSDNSQDLARLLTRQPEIGLTPIGFIATADEAPSQPSPACGGGQGSGPAQLPLPLIGTTADPGRNRRVHVEVAIFSSARDLAAVTCGPRAWMPSCQLLLVEDAHDIQSLWLHTRMLGGAIGIEIRRDLCPRYNRVLKRAIDILLAVPIVLLACPLICVLALVIKLVDRGPAFYVQDRVGRNGTTLRMFKLRTMYRDAERRLEEHLRRDASARAEWQRFFHLPHDPRVLPVIGSFLRRTSFDELPQLWNVLRGDMSLVGPRPFPSYHMRCFDAEFSALRVSVQPGITGMWQVSSRSDGDLQVQKAQDLFYIRNWSIWLDVYILLQTVLAVLSGKGAR
jgi:Undecaprenyl-phosphate galactose phosphotransferase WbaP